MSWVECCVDSEYEIFDQYPHQIRRKSNKRIIKEHGCHGYIQCSLNRKNCYKHRLIAVQFIPNPDNLPQVDHINHNRTDNRIENLRWVSSSGNSRNKSSYGKKSAEYLDQLPPDSVPIRLYKGVEFECYYYSKATQLCYYYNGVKYRILPYHTALSGMTFIRAEDVSHVYRSVYIQAWLREECIE